jgi:hypothetical protein
MLKWYIRYCIVAAIASIFIAALVHDFILADEYYIIIPGHVVPVQQPVTT